MDAYVNLKKISLDITKFSHQRFFLSKSKKNRILSDISLNLKKGDTLGIVGPNGAGKSTLLRIIANIYQPTSGLLKVNGKCLGFFGNIFYDEYLSGYEFIFNSLLLYGFSSSEIKIRIEAIIDFIDIGEYIFKPQYSYSEGMKARVSLATVLFSEPSIMLIDEGIGAGDRFFINKAKTKIESVLTSVPILVMSTHDEDLLKKFTKTSILICGGQIIETGSTEDILNFYRSDNFRDHYLK